MPCRRTRKVKLTLQYVVSALHSSSPRDVSRSNVSPVFQPVLRPLQGGAGRHARRGGRQPRPPLHIFELDVESYHRHAAARARAVGEESEGAAKTGLRRSPDASWSAESPPQGRKRRFATRSGRPGDASSGQRNAQRTGKTTPTRPRARRSGAKRARNLPAEAAGQASPSLYPSEDPTLAAAPLAPRPPNRHHLRLPSDAISHVAGQHAAYRPNGGPPSVQGSLPMRSCRYGHQRLQSRGNSDDERGGRCKVPVFVGVTGQG